MEGTSAKGHKGLKRFEGKKIDPLTREENSEKSRNRKSIRKISIVWAFDVHIIRHWHELSKQSNSLHNIEISTSYVVIT